MAPSWNGIEENAEPFTDDTVCEVVYSSIVRRIVLDTNVIVSALRSRRGSAFRLVSMVGTGRFEIGLSVPLALEYEDAALRASPISPAALSKILGYLCGVAHQQKIFYLWRPHLRDPQDHLVLEVAVASRASHLVTYNLRDLLDAERFGIQVVRPEDFLAQLED